MERAQAAYAADAKAARERTDQSTRWPVGLDRDDDGTRVTTIYNVVNPDKLLLRHVN